MIHKINNVPTIDPITIPAIEPPDMQLHELKPLDCRLSIRGDWDWGRNYIMVRYFWKEQINWGFTIARVKEEYDNAVL